MAPAGAWLLPNNSPIEKAVVEPRFFELLPTESEAAGGSLSQLFTPKSWGRLLNALSSEGPALLILQLQAQMQPLPFLQCAIRHLPPSPSCEGGTIIGFSQQPKGLFEPVKAPFPIVRGEKGAYTAIFSLEGGLLHYNRAFEARFLQSATDCKGAEELLPGLKEACAAAAASANGKLETALSCRAVSEEAVWVQWSFELMQQEEGRAVVAGLGYEGPRLGPIYENYTALINSLSDALLTTDLHGRIIFAATGWERLSGYAQAAATGTYIGSFCHPSEKDAFHYFLAAIRKHTRPLRQEHQLRLANGNWAWVETQGTFDIQNDRIILSIRSVHGRKQAEQKLQEANLLLKKAQQQAKIGGWRLGLGQGEVIWTEEVYRIHEVGFDFKPDLSKGLLFYHPENRAELAEALDKAQHQGASFDLTLQFKGLKQTPKWVRLTGEPEWEGGQIIAINGLIQDITREHNVLLELKRHRAQLENITSNIPGVVLQIRFAADGSASVPYLSEGAERLWGYTSQQLSSLPMELEEVIHPEDRAPLRQSFLASAKDLSPWSFEWRIVNTKGHTCWLSGKGAPKPTADGGITWDSIVWDITHRKKAEEEAIKQAAMQRILMQMASEYINIPADQVKEAIQQSLREIGSFVGADRAYLFEYDFAHQTTSCVFEWCAAKVSSEIANLQQMPFEDMEPIVAHHQRGESFVLENVAELPYPVMKNHLQLQGIKSLQTVPMLHNGECVGFVGFDYVQKPYSGNEHEQQLLLLFAQMVVNIRLRAQAQAQVEESQELLQKLTANVPGAIYQLDRAADGQYRLPFISAGIQSLTAYSPEQIQKDVYLAASIVHPKHLQRLASMVKSSAQRLSPLETPFRSVQPDGSERWLYTIATPERSTDGTTSWFGIIQDITEQKKLEEIRKFAQQMEAKNKEMEQFTYVASHDLQEPLRTIRSFAGLLAQRYKGQLDENADQFLHFITDAAGRMSNLIKGLLEYSQIGQKKKREEVDLEEVLQSILTDFSTLIQEKQATVMAHGRLPVLTGYRTELQGLMQNLLSNAIKFHRPGIPPIVEIQAYREEGQWVLSFKDNGIGIPADQQAKVFHLFQRLNPREAYEGTGIGLAHCQKIAELHGGRIWITSEEGEGSTFFVSLREAHGPTLY